MRDMDAPRISTGSEDDMGNPIAGLGRQRKPAVGPVWGHASLQQCLARPESRKGGHLSVVTRVPQLALLEARGGRAISEARAPPVDEEESFGDGGGWEASSESETGNRQGFQHESREDDSSNGHGTRDPGSSAGGGTAALRERTRRRLEMLAGRRKDIPALETAEGTSIEPGGPTENCGTQGGVPATTHRHLELGQRYVPRYRMGPPEASTGASYDPGSLQGIDRNLDPTVHPTGPGACTEPYPTEGACSQEPNLGRTEPATSADEASNANLVLPPEVSSVRLPSADASGCGGGTASRRPSRDSQTDRQTYTQTQGPQSGDTPFHVGTSDPSLGEDSHMTRPESAGYSPDPTIVAPGKDVGRVEVLEEAQVASLGRPIMENSALESRSSTRWDRTVIEAPRLPLSRQASQSGGVAPSLHDVAPAHGSDEPHAFSKDPTASAQHSEGGDLQPGLDVPATVVYTHELCSSEVRSACGEAREGTLGGSVLLVPEQERAEILPKDNGQTFVQNRVGEGHPVPQTVHLGTESPEVQGSTWDADELARERTSRGSSSLQRGPRPSASQRRSSCNSAVLAELTESGHVDRGQLEKMRPSDSGGHGGTHVTSRTASREGLLEPTGHEKSGDLDPTCQVGILHADTAGSEEGAGRDRWSRDGLVTLVKAGEAVAHVNVPPSGTSQERAARLTNDNSSTTLTLGSSSGEGFRRVVSSLVDVPQADLMWGFDGTCCEPEEGREGMTARRCVRLRLGGCSCSSL